MHRVELVRKLHPENVMQSVRAGQAETWRRLGFVLMHDPDPPEKPGLTLMCWFVEAMDRRCVMTLAHGTRIL